ncbi:hypothetical protein BEP19_10125 [Ammoniphilus oxalaticus]|uniref:Bifunctional NAD(P)H-hydrate repair enzyme n=1 Tax=Ammoniphilus oxalaticus TaxID=66863 RepID=A0A419SFP6_9BACL|nr:NAD(P)H-hydrate dehydratase [Ammoniphilus oxalaticus]RKD22608.1 hypothetical protein BEP19_10125 [Ammoniphilus oxalaticus]
MYLVNARQMREMDRFAIEKIGIPSIVLMETAGQAVAQEVEQRYPQARLVVIAGHGNNGGDAFVLSRHLQNRGFAVNTWLVGSEEKMTADTAIAYRALVQSRVHVQKLTPKSWNLFCRELSGADVIIDGLVGTGIKGSLREEAARVVMEINKRKDRAAIVSVDIPSGINADNGVISSVAVSADLTVTFACPRWGHFLFPGAGHCGRLIVRDIGIPAWVGEELGIKARLLQDEFISTLIPKRARHSHKGSYGHVLVIAGSQSYVGAPALTALGAIRSGAGMVTLALPESIQSMVVGLTPEAVYWPWADKAGSFAPHSWEALRATNQPRYDCVVVGPGLGHEVDIDWLKQVIDRTSGPLLLDADALNLLGQDLTLTENRMPVILTPHPGEIARIMKMTVQEVEENRQQIAVKFARQHRVYLVLKGTYSIIATPQGTCFVSPRGSSSLAKGGSGDVLSGMIASFINQTGDVLAGLQCAVYVHGMAGELMDEYSGGASDLGLWIGQALQALAQKDRDNHTL